MAARALPRARRGGRSPRVQSRTERVERTTGLRYGALMLDETVAPAPLDEETARLLADAVLARGLERLPGGDAMRRCCRVWRSRGARCPRRPAAAAGGGDVAGLVRAACAGRSELRRAGRSRRVVLATLPPDARRALDTAAPERITLASGRSVPIHYDRATRRGSNRACRISSERAPCPPSARARPADRASAGAQRPRRAGDARSRRLLDAALPGPAPPARPPLSRNMPGPKTAPPPTRRRPCRRAALADVNCGAYTRLPMTLRSVPRRAKRTKPDVPAWRRASATARR